MATSEDEAKHSQSSDRPRRSTRSRGRMTWAAPAPSADLSWRTPRPRSKPPGTEVLARGEEESRSRRATRVPPRTDAAMPVLCGRAGEAAGKGIGQWSEF